MKYRACIFDLDGTLCDSVVSIGHCANKALMESGFPPIEMECYKMFVGAGADEMVRKALCKVGDEELVHFDEMRTSYLEYFKEECLYEVRLYEGIRELICELKERGLKTAVLSNKPHENSRRVISALFDEGCFDYVQGQMDGIERKPDPAGAFMVAEKLQVKPEECLYIGDTSIDMKTGNAAGMDTVGVLWGFRDRTELEENGAKHLIEQPSQLLQLLQEENL